MALYSIICRCSFFITLRFILLVFFRNQLMDLAIYYFPNSLISCLSIFLFSYGFLLFIFYLHLVKWLNHLFLLYLVKAVNTFFILSVMLRMASSPKFSYIPVFFIIQS